MKGRKKREINRAVERVCTSTNVASSRNKKKQQQQKII
jgi:hypothetical protein